MKILPRLLALLAIATISFPATAVDEPEPFNSVTMHVFMSETCPHCRAQKPFLAGLDARHPELEIRQMEIMTTREHHELLRNMASLHGVQPGSVPMIFVGGRVWTGDSRQIRREIVEQVEACLENRC